MKSESYQQPKHCIFCHQDYYELNTEHHCQTISSETCQKCLLIREAFNKQYCPYCGNKIQEYN